MSSYSTAPATQAKASKDPSKAIHLQFDSIGMQVPVRTTSAPLNLDEQKCDQARQDTYRSVPNIPTPSVPKQQLPRKDAGAPDQSSTGEVHQVPMVKKDPQVSLPPTTSQTQKPSVLPILMTSMQMPFHQPQVSGQFGGHKPHIHSQNVTATSLPLPMPIPLTMGNAPQVQQHMFVPSLQPYPMQPQGLMHLGQGVGFTTQMGPPRLPFQLGNMGMRLMGKTPQYPQQQGGKFGGGPRKTVVNITHPDTHKEVRLDERADTYPDGGVSGPRSQSQPIPSFAHAHPINYYPNSYGAGSIYYPAPDSLPLTSSQITPSTQATRFNYMVGQGPQNVIQQQSAPVSAPEFLETIPKNEMEVPDNSGVGSVLLPVASSKDKTVVELNRSKSSTARGKKKREKILQKADAAGTTSSSKDKTVVELNRSMSSTARGKKKRKEILPKADAAGTTSTSKDKTVVELNRSKSSTAQGKKKIKEILQKADAARTTSDLYMACKGPEEKKETVPSESAESTPTVGNSNQEPVDTVHVDAVPIEKSGLSKAEPDDWEDAADISTPKLEPSDGREQAPGVHRDEDGNGNIGKKYSRDFLLKFSKQCTDLPEGFEIANDKAEALMSGNINVSHLVYCGLFPSPGRVMDRKSGGPRADRRGSVMVDDDRCGRPPGPSLGRDLRLDVGYGANAGFCPGQGSNYGVLRNPRAQILIQYPGGTLPRPMQPMSPQVGVQRNSLDVDRWQRFFNFQQRGLIPSPQTPLQMMHKADRKYEVGKVQDEEDSNPSDISSQSATSKSPELVSQTEQECVLKATAVHNDVPILGITEGWLGESARTATDCSGVGSVLLPVASSKDKTVVELNRSKSSTARGKKKREEILQKADAAGTTSTSKDKTVVDLNRSKRSTARGKKKIKEILQKADAARTTSDLYMACKGPEEKKETVPSESAESTPTVGNSNQEPVDTVHVDAVPIEKSGLSKAEPDDWEDAADISTPKLEPSDGREQAPGVHRDEDGNGNVGKKYSRDFLLKFSKQCTDLPEGFEIATDKQRH